MRRLFTFSDLLVFLLGVVTGLYLIGCSFPTEPSGCIKYESGVTFSGKRAYAYQCWGDALPSDSLDHPEWW